MISENQPNTRTFDVTVVIAAYNAADFLLQTLESIASQTRPPAEIIIVDDGSKDSTLSLANTFAARTSIATKVVKQENGGPSKARNTGLDLAQTKWIIFFDADDIMLPNYIECFASACDIFPEVHWFGAEFFWIDQTGKRLNDSTPRMRDNYQKWVARAFQTGQTQVLTSPFAAVLEGMLAWNGAQMVSRQALNAVGPYDEALRQAEDFEMWLRLARKFDYAFIPELVSCYRRHPESLTQDGTAPFHWAIKVLKTPGLIDPAFAALKRKRLADFHLANSYFYRETRQYRAARGEGFRACLNGPLRVNMGKNLIAAILER